MPPLPKVIREMTNTLGPKIREAYLLAYRVHDGENRQSSEPYITHPIAVAKILFDAGADEVMVCAALLHDTLESQTKGEVDRIGDQIYTDFGDEVFYLVQAISKDGNILSKVEQQKAYIEQMEHAIEVDIFFFFIKVADLLHNIETIAGLPPKRRARWLKELKYQYLPLSDSFFHRIPLPYRDMYAKLKGLLEEKLSSMDTEHSRST